MMLGRWNNTVKIFLNGILKVMNLLKLVLLIIEDQRKIKMKILKKPISKTTKFSKS